MKLASAIRLVVIVGALVVGTAFSHGRLVVADVEGPREDVLPTWVKADREGPREEIFPGYVRA